MWKELKHDASSSYQEFDDFTIVKVHNLVEGFGHKKAEAKACYFDYTLDYKSFALSEVFIKTLSKFQA